MAYDYTEYVDRAFAGAGCLDDAIDQLIEDGKKLSAEGMCTRTVSRDASHNVPANPAVSGLAFDSVLDILNPAGILTPYSTKIVQKCSIRQAFLITKMTFQDVHILATSTDTRT